MSVFDPNTFLQETVTGANDTKYPVIPAGEYPALVDKIDVRQMDDKNKPGNKFTVLDVTWSIEDAHVREATKMEKVTARQSVFLNLDTSTGKLDMQKAKNVQLGKLRDALGLNDPDRPFAFSQFVGQPATVRIEHTANPNDPESPYSNVTRVAQQ